MVRAIAKLILCTVPLVAIGIGAHELFGRGVALLTVGGLVWLDVYILSNIGGGAHDAKRSP